MVRIGYLFLLLSNMACNFSDPLPATEEQKKYVLNSAVFDPVVITSLHRYFPLQAFLVKYGDTIISYRDSKNYVIEVENGNKIDTVLKKQDCYHFVQGNPNENINNVPDFLKFTLDSLYKQIGDSDIGSFNVCRDKEITITIRVENKEAGLSLFHCLLWNAKIGTDYTFIGNRDTLINQNCIYRIGMTESHGH